MEEEITMLNWLRKRKEDNKGFTLVELIIVIAILAILVGLLAPQYMKYVEKSRKSTDVNNLERLVEAVKIASADVDYNIPAGEYTITINSASTAVEVDNASGNDKDGALTTIKTALSEFAGSDYTTRKLKSARWQGNAISATVTINEKSAVTVSYTPDEVKTLVK